MPEPLARVLVCVRVVRRLVHNLYLHFTDANARSRMIWNIKIARERTQLFELKLVNDGVLLVGHGQLELAILASTEILNRPDHLTLRYVKISTVRVLRRLLGLHHGLGRVNVAVGVDDGRLEARDVLPRRDEGPASTRLILLVDKDA